MCKTRKVSDILRYIHTLRYLKPKQIIGQIKKPLVLRKTPYIPPFNGNPNTAMHLAIDSLDRDEGYLQRFSVDALLRGEITLLNESRSVDWSTWHAADASSLWLFNLNYFEYAVALAARYRNNGQYALYEKFKEYVTLWITANPVGKGEAWHPYTISMRIPNWLICFDLFGKSFSDDTAFCKVAYESVYAQYKALTGRVEHWQLGNHYFENLKTLALCSLLFEETMAYKKYIRLFLRELHEEILPDGVHFELSLMYHKIILEDTIRITYCLQQKQKPEFTEILPCIQKMTDALASLEYGMGKTPLFNDAGENVAKEGKQLLEAVNALFGIVPAYNDSFPESGYYKLYDGSRTLLFDAGKIGPDYMPGHGHCDCLSFELSIDEIPLFINAGTYKYQGDRRAYFRSTRAHNTVMVGDREQSECWGEHRVARRISHIEAKRDGQLITGYYESYWGDRHTRMLSLADSALSVLDMIGTTAGATIQSYLRISPDFAVSEEGGHINIKRDDETVCEIYPIKSTYIIHIDGGLSQYAPSFGVLLQVPCLEFTWQADSKQHGYIVKFN